MTFGVFSDPYWCKACESYRVRSLGALCPVCDDDTPPRPIPRPRMEHDPRPQPISTTAGEA